MSPSQRPASDAGDADLEEIPLDHEPSAWDRVRCGILVEQGLLGGAVVERWQEAVREGSFDADQCTRELLSEPVAPGAEQRAVLRTRTLLRDLLMSRLARGVGRRRAKTALAVLISQTYLLLVLGGLFFAALLLLRLRGVGIDAFLDRVLGTFG